MIRIFVDRDIYGSDILVSMSPDEYGQMCEFMKDNAVGYGRHRDVANKWRDAKDVFDKRKRKR